MIEFDHRVTSALEAKLNPDVIKTRDQSGITLSYIEGWWAIREANRIFGHDGWNMTFSQPNCVYAVEAEEQKYDKFKKEYKTVKRWRVSYNVICTVTVGTVIRQDVGSGHGIDTQCGIAHESAIKEAFTDAMKRALRTFGNPFGLALYDKQREGVAASEEEAVISDTDKFKEIIDQYVQDGTLTSVGVKTICKLLGVPAIEKIRPSDRKRVMGMFDKPDSLALINEGKNGKGVVVVPVDPPGESIEEIEKQVKEVMS